MYKRFLFISSILLSGSTQAFAAAKLTAYPASWSTSTSQTALPAQATRGSPAYALSWTTSSPTGVCADGVVGCKLYGPIHSKLGTGAMAAANNPAAISKMGATLALKTINPSSSGVGGTDVNVQTMDNHGHGFSLTNGYIEAVISLPAAHGNHSGFWLDNVQTAQGHGEIDFPETYGAADHVFASAAHWWPAGASRFQYEVHVGYYWSPSPSPYGVAHRYGVLLTSSQICTYMDRKQVACVARLPEQQGPMYALISNFTDANRKDGYQPATMQITSLTAWGK